jgi:hypothetical protein
MIYSKHKKRQVTKLSPLFQQSSMSKMKTHNYMNFNLLIKKNTIASPKIAKLLNNDNIQVDFVPKQLKSKLSYIHNLKMKKHYTVKFEQKNKLITLL